MYTIHRTNEDKIATLYVYDGKKVKKYKAEQILEFVDSNPDSVRTLQVNAGDSILVELANVKCKILHAHWHSIDIDKGSTPEEIVTKLYSIAPEGFKEFKPEVQIVELRKLIAMRDASLQATGDYNRRIKQIGRNELKCSKEDLENDDDLSLALEQGKSLSKIFNAVTEGKYEITLETKIKHVTANISEVLLFESIAGVARGSMWAAKVIALSAGMARFPTVASYWHYSGEHVVEGKAPKRKVGSPVDWHTDLRTTNWQGVNSCLMQKDKWKWYDFFSKTKEKELLTHPKGHAHNRAMRKTRKEILKKFWIACNSSNSGGEAVADMKPRGDLPLLKNSA